MADRFPTRRCGQIKKAGTCLSKESLWTGPTTIDILPICTTPRMASKHTKPDCPSAVKKLSRFSLLDELPFALGISRPSGTTKIGKNRKITRIPLREWVGCCLCPISMTYDHDYIMTVVFGGPVQNYVLAVTLGEVGFRATNHTPPRPSSISASTCPGPEWADLGLDGVL